MVSAWGPLPGIPVLNFEMKAAPYFQEHRELLPASSIGCKAGYAYQGWCGEARLVMKLFTVTAHREGGRERERGRDRYR